MIARHKRRRMLRTGSTGPAMLRYLEEIGIERLPELCGTAPGKRAGVGALCNLVASAEEQPRRSETSGHLPKPAACPTLLVCSTIERR